MARGARRAVAVQAAWDGACLRVGGRARSAVFVGVAAGAWELRNEKPEFLLSSP